MYCFCHLRHCRIALIPIHTSQLSLLFQSHCGDRFQFDLSVRNWEERHCVFSVLSWMNSLVSMGDSRVNPMCFGGGALRRLRKTSVKQPENMWRWFDQVTEWAVPSLLWLWGNSEQDTAVSKGVQQRTVRFDSWQDQQYLCPLVYPETEELSFTYFLFKNSSPPLSWMFTVNIPPPPPTLLPTLERCKRGTICGLPLLTCF